MRIEIEDSGHQLTVRIPPPRSAFAFVYLPAALGICLWAAASAVREALSGSPKADEAAVTIPVFVAVGAFVLYGLLRMILGHEVLVLDDKSLVLSRRTFGVLRVWRCDLHQVRNLRTERVFSGRTAYIGYGSVRIVFDFGARELSCGASVDEPEAAAIVARLKAWSPVLAAQSAA